MNTVNDALFGFDAYFTSLQGPPFFFRFSFLGMGGLTSPSSPCYNTCVLFPYGILADPPWLPMFPKSAVGGHDLPWYIHHITTIRREVKHKRVIFYYSSASGLIVRRCQSNGCQRVAEPWEIRGNSVDILPCRSIISPLARPLDVIVWFLE